MQEIALIWKHHECVYGLRSLLHSNLISFAVPLNSGGYGNVCDGMLQNIWNLYDRKSSMSSFQYKWYLWILKHPGRCHHVERGIRLSFFTHSIISFKCNISENRPSKLQGMKCFSKKNLILRRIIAKLTEKPNTKKTLLQSNEISAINTSR